jgi:hypothetical protein
MKCARLLDGPLRSCWCSRSARVARTDEASSNSRRFRLRQFPNRRSIWILQSSNHSSAAKPFSRAMPEPQSSRPMGRADSHCCARSWSRRTGSPLSRFPLRNDRHVVNAARAALRHPLESASAERRALANKLLGAMRPNRDARAGRHDARHPHSASSA